MNIGIIDSLIANPSVFIVKFIAEPLAGAAFAYGLVWLFMRSKDGRTVPNLFLWHSLGVAAAVAGGAMFRIVAMAIFAGRSAYEPAVETGAAGFYVLIVPAIVAAGYIAWLKTRMVPKSVAASQTNLFAETAVPKPTSSEPKGNAAYAAALAETSISLIHASASTVPVDEDSAYATVAEELESGKTDKGLWTRLFAECGGDEKQTKVQYIQRRAEKLMAFEARRREQLALDEAKRQKQLAIEAEEAARRQRRDAGLADAELIHAVSNGNWADANTLLASGVSPFGSNDDGVALRDLANIRRDLPMLKLLKSYEMKSLGAEVIAAVDKFNSGSTLKIDDVTLLVDAAAKFPDFVTMRSAGNGYTLLHWCGALGLDKSGGTLLDLGADAAAFNDAGQQAHHLTRSTTLADILAAAALGVH